MSDTGVGDLLRSVGRLLSSLPLRRRVQLLGITLLMLLGAVAEVATLGAVIPFLAVLAEPSGAQRYPVLGQLFRILGWDQGNMLVPATVLFITVALVAGTIRMTLLWVSFKFTYGIGLDVGVEVYRRVLYQPYKFHVAHNTSEVIAGINKVQTVISGVVTPMMLLGIAVVLSVAIFGGLVLIDPTIAIIVGGGFSLIYLMVTLGTKRRLAINGATIARSETSRIQAVQEGLGGIRDVLIDNSQDHYVDRFRQMDARLRNAQASNAFMGNSPKYLIEALGMIAIGVLAYVLSLGNGGLVAAIPLLGALAIGAQKLMPQLQQVYFSWSAIASSRAVLDDVLDLLEQPIPEEYASEVIAQDMRFDHDIVFRDVSFEYASSSKSVVEQLNFRIRKGERIGIIGKTGSGKSTTIDLLMGLLEPSSGSIEIDGKRLDRSNRRAWQARIAHVPQSIYLSDATIAENIAFGINAGEIDLARVRETARTAQISDYVESLPDQYMTWVGERGVRLSGGQRQRIGIARALYQEADMMLLDEATSALDDGTEHAVMQTIEALGGDLTVVVVAHRLSTLAKCDRVLEMRRGKLSEAPLRSEPLKSRVRESNA